MGKRELVALLNLSSWCLVRVERLFFAVPWGCLRFVITAFPVHTHLLFLVLRFVLFHLSVHQSICPDILLVHYWAIYCVQMCLVSLGLKCVGMVKLVMLNSYCNDHRPF